MAGRNTFYVLMDGDTFRGTFDSPGSAKDVVNERQEDKYIDSWEQREDGTWVQRTGVTTLSPYRIVPSELNRWVGNEQFVQLVPDRVRLEAALGPEKLEAMIHLSETLRETWRQFVARKAKRENIPYQPGDIRITSAGYYQASLARPGYAAKQDYWYNPRQFRWQSEPTR